MPAPPARRPVAHTEEVADPPRERLAALLLRLDGRAGRLRQRSLWFSRLRLALVLGGGLAALVAGQVLGAGGGWLAALAVLAAFLALVQVHDRVEAALARTVLYRLLQTRHLARLDLDWSALPGDASASPPDHPFASDLDVVGPRSLLGLLTTAGTEGGHGRLRAWLLAADPDPAAARLRQAQVRALLPHRRFRERLALLGHEAAGSASTSVDARWSDRALRAWLDAPPPTAALRRWALGLSVHAAVTAGLVAWSWMGGPSLWGFSLLLYLVLYGRLFRGIASVFEQSHDLQIALREVVPVLLWMERTPALRAEVLQPLGAPFRGDARPSRHLVALRRIASATAFTKNEVGRVVLNVLLPYDLLLWLALARLRTRLAGQLAPWLGALYDAEALSALAAYADLRPSTVAFPELLDGGDGAPLFDAAALRHPVLPDEQAVGNDLALAPGEVLILTGSNMAGKSTFLRAVGLASVLAWAGGAVPAASLRLCPLRPAASMRIGDQLQEGLSTFYAEVRRLRLLLDAVEKERAAPALVLIDEMLRGTNNRERLAGARAFSEALAGAHAASMVATHDLALTELAGDNDRVRNAHFREEAEGDRLVFDYTLRDGPCPTTNALIIMQRAGLPVPVIPNPAAV